MAKKNQKEDADWEFIFDGVFGFLSSPLWSVPVMSFIDTQCVVFEPSEENHLEWTAIHNKYRVLVESLLTSYLEDVGITEPEFMKACMSETVQRSVEMQMIFEQIFAGEDFEIFKNMMIQRNVELELEALKLVQKRQGKSKDSKMKKSRVPTEEEILQEVMKRSEEEYKQSQKKRSAEDAEYNETVEKMIASTTESERLEQEVISKQEETKRVVQESIERDQFTVPSAPPVEEMSVSSPPTPYTKTNVPDVAMKHTASTKTDDSGPHIAHKNPPPAKTEHSVPDVVQVPDVVPKSTPSTRTKESVPVSGKSPSKSFPDTQETRSGASSNKSPIKTPQSPAKSPPLSPLKGLTGKERLPGIMRDPTSSEAADQWMQNAREENASSSVGSRAQNNSDLSEADLKKREEYLKQQRDRIQKMKNEEREKQLLSYTKNAPERPVSARVAKDAVSGEAKPSEDEEKQLAMRKMLAEKLKKEVIYKDDA